MDRLRLLADGFNSCLAALTPHLQLALDIFILVLHLLMPVLIAAVDCPVLLHPFAILNLNEFLDVGGQHELRLLGCDRLQTLDHEHIALVTTPQCVSLFA